MGDDDVPSAESSPLSGPHSQYSPFASRLIRDSKNSTIKSKFSPSAFEDIPNISTDATIDQETDDEDDVMADNDDSTRVGSGNAIEEIVPGAHDRVLAIPEAGSGSLVTPSAGRKAFATFDPTPYKKAIGRDYSRATIFDKTSAMHVYGGLGVLTLLGGVLHMCHVLPVATKDKDLDDLAHGIGERLINLSSSLNFWIMTPTFHYSVDTGLIKFLPTRELMDAMESYLRDLHDLRDKWENKEITLEQYNAKVNGELRRRQLFPNANYPYIIAGVLCQSGFLIPRHEVNDSQQDFEMPVEEIHNEGTEYEISIKRFPVPLRRTQADPTTSNRSGSSKPQDHHPKIARVLPAFRAVNPTIYDEDEVFWLWQDPFFVLINAGEFIHALRERWNNNNRDKEFKVDDFSHNNTHAALLRRALTLYEAIVGAPAPPGLTGNSQESPSRPPRTRTRSKTAPSRAVDKSQASTKKTRNSRAVGSQHNVGTKRNASAMDGDESRTEGTRRSRRLKLEEPEPDMNGRVEL
ncbi:hypothetical protein AAF712_002946 [Marasmius tenuissimus]|uniref:Uncharacterized protein n=1 Tax=Marasmius tenuissimus TaxID=585030 RepID=A0ABR3A9M8_9AGAR